MSVLFAATYPQRTRALVLYGTLREAAAQRRLPVGADLGGAASRPPTSSSETWGENVDLSTMIPNADAADERVVRAARDGPR